MGTSESKFTLGPSSLREALFESLRHRIINGDIPPGERVTELRVAEEYGVARPTAKACIEQLTSLGLLKRSMHKAATVPNLDVSEIEDLFFSRSVFESTAIAHLARSSTVPEEVLKAQRSIILATDNDDFPELVEADIAFHWGLVNGFDSERLSRMYSMISGEIQLTIGQYRAHRRTSLSKVAAEHQAVIDAAATGDVDAATTALIEHIEQAKNRILEELRGSTTSDS